MLVVAAAPLAELIRLALGHGLYTVEVASNVATALERRQSWKPHLLIVDIDVVDGDARRLIGDLSHGQRLPTIVLTERGDLKTKLDAFERGADDFLSLPLSPDELVARTLALIRRTYGEGVPLVATLHIGDLEIDLLNRRVRAGGSTVRLTDIEQALLYLLASNAGTTLPRERILDTVWGSDYVAESNLVDRHVRNLRVKLHDDWRRPRFIRTVPGKGYRFIGARASN